MMSVDGVITTCIAMFELLLTAQLLTPVEQSTRVQQFCSEVVGLTWSSDNFTDDEWERFQLCRESIRPVIVSPQPID